MAATFYGTLVEIGIRPAAGFVPRPGFGKQALLLAGMLLMPFGFGRGRTGLTAARANPPRYLVRVCDVRPADLRQVLTTVKPPPVAVRVLTKPGPLRYPSPARPGTSLPLAAPEPGLQVSATAQQ